MIRNQIIDRGLLAAVDIGPINVGMLMVPMRMESPQARVMLLAIGLQESALRHRWQILPNGAKGEARGLWQFERGGGCVGVLSHSSVAAITRDACVARGVAPTPSGLWQALEYDDSLAAASARLLLWTDPQPLPAMDDEAGAWQLYLKVWRPGAYARGDIRTQTALRDKWGRNHAAAREYIASRDA